MQEAHDQREPRGFWGLVGAQFLGAFNDNALRWFLIALAMREIKETGQIANVMSWATNIFLLPFLIFSMHAGWLADHFSKRNVLMASKAAEVAVMAACVLGLYFGAGFSFWLPFLLAALFFMGTQSTYYSPAKFGILPEILPENRLSRGNAIFEMTGMIAIILGTIAGAESVGMFPHRLYLAPVIFTSAAVLGFIATCFVPHLPAAASTSRQRLNPFRALAEHGSKLLRNRILLATLLSIVFIWSLGVLFQLNIALYAKESLGLAERHASQPMGIVAVGVALGTLLAGYLSGKTIEIGLVPVAATGIALVSVLLFFTSGSLSGTFLAVLLLGCFAGLFIVPTHALLQEESPREDKGGVWAATNFLQTLGMLVAAHVFAVLSANLALSPPQVFLLCGLGTLLLSAGLLALMPQALGRTLVWVTTLRRRPRTITGQHGVPPHGPVLFVVAGPPGPRGYLLLSGTRRFVRFFLDENVVRGVNMRFLAWNLKAIRLPAAAEGSVLDDAVRRVESALQEGSSVALFEESLPADSIRKLRESVSCPVFDVAIGDRTLSFGTAR